MKIHTDSLRYNLWVNLRDSLWVKLWDSLWDSLWHSLSRPAQTFANERPK
jgi:hypothetical protein